MTMRGEHAGLPTIGWREWLALPDLAVPWIKVKVDTGARSSALHAFDVDIFERDGRTFASFEIHPIQRSTRGAIRAEAAVIEFRDVRSSGGHVTRRPVISTHVELLGQRWPIELTLASRDAIGFRMLLGREAVRGRLLVDAGHSYVNGVPASRPGKRRKKKRREE
ncbi:MAG: ATP-dependent zinc protease [Planctomycetales bacterium]|nr:ATP-dependent zinc protease [Planctomycetales bacterium]